MTGEPDGQSPDLTPDRVAGIESLSGLGLLLRQLRRRDARCRARPEVTYRELAAKTGWSHATIGEYFTGNALPPTDRFDILIRLLGARPAELRGMATARDRVEERRRQKAPASRGNSGQRADSRPAAPIVGHDSAAAEDQGRVVPRQLPPAVRHFAGRVAELAALTSLLDHEVGVAGPDRPSPKAWTTCGTVVISAINGTAGIGKTTLAIHWAHRVASRFPDGQLYVNLRGFDPAGSPMTPAEAVRGFLDALGIPPDRVPVSLDAQAGLYRSLLAGRRMLLVLDNARDAEQVRPLLPGSPQCLVVVTSRNRLTQLIAAEAAQPLTLDLLTAQEARELLVRRLGQGTVASEPEAVDEIVALCARLPLALSIVAARAAGHPGFPLAALASELRDARGGLDAFDAGDAATDFRAVFSWSYRTVGTEAARLFRLLGLHPGPDIAVPAAASLAGLRRRHVRAALAELIRAHLIAEHMPGRFALHDLLRAYASELVATLDPAELRREASGRMLDHYLHSARAAARLLNPHRDPITSAPPGPGMTPELPESPAAALAWFTREHHVLAAVIRQAADLGFDTYAWQLAWTLDDFFDRRGHWHDWEAIQHTALDAARRSGDAGAQARARCALGVACDRLGRYEDAHIHLRQALDLYGELDDDTGRAYAHMRLGGLNERQGRYSASLGHAQQALSKYGAADHRAGQAEALNLVGWSHARLGDYRQALTCCGQALALQQDIGDRLGQANTWDSLGYAHHGLDDYRRAADCYRYALDLFKDLGYRYYEAVALTHIGDTEHAAGDRHAARDAWQDALAILGDMDRAITVQVRTRVDCPDAEQVRAKLQRLEDPDRSPVPAQE